MSILQELASEMAARGTRRAYGVPGGGASLELIDAMERSGIEFVTTVTEGAAGVMAGTEGRLLGRAGVALAIKGPGLANLVPGLAACLLEALPMVAITEAYPPDAPPAQSHKRMDHDGLVRAVAKGRWALSSKGPSFGGLADWAEREPPGPVHLELTGRDERDQPGFPSQPLDQTDPAAWGRAQRILRNAHRPIVVVGTLAIRRGWSRRLASLAVPILTTAAAKGVVDETTPAAAGVFTGVGLGLTPETNLLDGADVVIGFGLRTQEVLAARPFGRPTINVDPLGKERSPGFEVDEAVGEDRVEEVFAWLEQRSWGLEELAGLRQRLYSSMRGSGIFLPLQIYDEAWRCFDGKARLVVDTGSFCTIAEHAWRSRAADLFLGAGQSRYMGIGTPMALAAALEDPTVPTLLAVGDGGVGMAFGELRLARDRRLPLLVLLMSDGGFGSIRGRALEQGLTERPLIMSCSSWLRAAEGLGIPAREARDTDAVVRALEDWSPAEGPLFLECVFDPDHYLAMTRGIR